MDRLQIFGIVAFVGDADVQTGANYAREVGVGEPPSPYSRARHRAWLSRKGLGLIDEDAA